MLLKNLIEESSLQSEICELNGLYQDWRDQNARGFIRFGQYLSMYGEKFFHENYYYNDNDIDVFNMAMQSLMIKSYGEFDTPFLTGGEK